ncbi:MAG: hypothetical protein HQ594_05275, partial [Candidatus Omnitrophica bacterium]|nr:hypothetical protein [Candidatus Omnitrophota bacterium]
MKIHISRIYKITGILLALCFAAGMAYAETYEYYDSNNVLRQYADTGHIYEYYDEDLFPGDEWWNAGRLILSHEGGVYKTWDWDTLSAAGQAIVEEYAGDYLPAADSPAWSALQTSQRTVRYVYDHNDDWELDTSANTWVEREKVIYSSNGTTVQEKYLRDSSARLVRQVYTPANFVATYAYQTQAGAENLELWKKEYLYNEVDEAAVINGTMDGTLQVAYVYELYVDGAGATQKRLKREIHDVASGYHQANTYYEYTYHNDSTEQIKYKNVYAYSDGQEDGVINGTTQGTLDASYEYVDTDYMVKRTYSGGSLSTVTTLLLDASGVSYSNTYLDTSNNIMHIFNWDDSWNLINVVKKYPNGTIEVCTPNSPSDPVWPIQEKRIPSGSFATGVNLPWLGYGYDIGRVANGGAHYGFSSKTGELYEKMERWAGSTVRVWLFANFKAGMEFSDGATPADDGTVYPAGTPLKFTDKVYEDMQALLDCAEALGIKVMPVLFDYLLGGEWDKDTGVPSRGIHVDLIEDPVKRQALIDIIRPFIQQFRDHPALYAWDIMNEPKCAYESGGVSFDDLYGGFIKEFADMLNTEDPDHPVTAGNRSRTAMMQMLQYWSDNGVADPLDLLQFHYYDYMAQGKPLDYTFNAAEQLLINGRDIIAGELQPTDFTDKLDIIQSNGLVGGLFWQDSSFIIDDAMWQEIEDWFYGTVYEYDSSNRLIKETKPDGSYKTFSSYYAGTSIAKYVNEYDSSGDFVVGYRYDAIGRVDRTKRPTEMVYTSYWDGTNTEKKQDMFYSGSDSAGWQYTSTIQYYTDGTTVHYQWLSDANPDSAGDTISYEYNADGNLVKQVLDDGTYKRFSDYFIGTNQARYVSEYDASGNLQVTYEYDINGNYVGSTYPADGTKRYTSGNL